MKEKIIKGLKWFYQSFIWLFIVFLSIDIFTKRLVIHLGKTPGSQIADWGIVRINYVLNYNAAFGLGASDPTVSRVIYLIVASLISAGIITYLIIKRKSMKLYVRACFMLVITGAIGNMIDRIFYAPYHAVVDWIDFYWFWGYNFNIADSCIVVAAFMLAIYLIVIEVKEYRRKRKEETISVKQLSKTEKERLEEENTKEDIAQKEEKND